MNAEKERLGESGDRKVQWRRDPDRHPFGLPQFPEGTHDLEWHRAGNRLGVETDHTVITV
jgi:hypothetical protein